MDFSTVPGRKKVLDFGDSALLFFGDRIFTFMFQKFLLYFIHLTFLAILPLEIISKKTTWTVLAPFHDTVAPSFVVFFAHHKRFSDHGNDESRWEMLDSAIKIERRKEKW